MTTIFYTHRKKEKKIKKKEKNSTRTLIYIKTFFNAFHYLECSRRGLTLHLLIFCTKQERNNGFYFSIFVFQNLKYFHKPYTLRTSSQ